ncbi:hypothetical protein C7T87_22915 [Xanthomonas hortorum pv. hederae]|nr:hypothetical protein C7T87_22915 [Xanthomonas hortorum pv. hederae]
MLHGRTCGVSREGGRARALQQIGRSAALQLIYTTDLSALFNHSRTTEISGRNDVEMECKSTGQQPSWSGPRARPLAAHAKHCLALRQTGAFAPMHEPGCTA